MSEQDSFFSDTGRDGIGNTYLYIPSHSIFLDSGVIYPSKKLDLLYRLEPENMWPRKTVLICGTFANLAALSDCYSILSWVWS